MTTLVVTVLGDDRTGLVDRLAGVVRAHGGSWERSRMAHLAGTFAGIVLVSVPDAATDDLRDGLRSLEAEGLFEVTVRVVEEPAEAGPVGFDLDLVGLDRPGVVHDLAEALAGLGVSIAELEADTRDAPMAGGRVFEVRAALAAPAGTTGATIEDALVALSSEFVIDVTDRA